MEQYISKSALVAEIERRIKNLYPKEGQGMVVTKILKDHYEDLLDSIDTLEVKEVDLEKHLKEDSVHRTKADVDAAMQDVEEKSKAFTEAHKRESSNEILAQMRGEEPVNEDLEEEIECSLPKPAWGWNEDYFGKSNPAYSMGQMKEFAKHFFELGMQVSNKAQKGE